MSVNSRSALLCTSAILGALLLSPATGRALAQNPGAQAVTYNLPKQPLSASLREYAQVSGQQIIFVDDLVAGKTAPELRGSYSSEEALASLLAGSGLTAARSPSGTLMVQIPKIVRPAANEAAAAEPETRAAKKELDTETIVITGFKRPENVQNVASSVFVVTDKVLERTNVRDFDDLANIAPNLTITKTTQPGNNSINIRGIGTYSYSIATEASTAIVVDDIPQAFQAEAFQALADVAQVEILRGPQSTLFGKSASAGVINITTKLPTDIFTIGVEAMATDDHEYRIGGSASGPLSDTVKYRIALNADRYRGNLHNLYNNSWVDGHADVSVQAKLVWEPDDDWQITLSPHYDNTRATCCTWAYYFVSPGVTFGKFGPARYQADAGAVLGAIQPGSNNREISADVNPKGNALDYGGGVKIVRHFNDYTLMSITGYDRYDLHDLQDTEATSFNWGPGGANIPGAIAGGSANGGWFNINSITQELRLVSPDSGRLRYIAGLFFSRTGSERQYVRGSNSLTQDGSLMTVPAGTSLYADYFAHAFDTNMAVFAQATFDITSALSVIGGLRANREQIAYSLWDKVNNVRYGTPRCSTATPSGLSGPTCNKNDSLSGKMALQYHITPQIMVFGSYDVGYKGQAYDLTSTLTQRNVIATGPLAGYPVADATVAQQPIAEETVDAFQLGIKSRLFDSVIVNVTLFDEIYENFQAQSRDEFLVQNVLNSIGQVTSRGVEWEVMARLSGSFNLSAAGSYDEVTIDSFPNAACYSTQGPAQGCSGGKQDLSGKTLFDAPKWQFNLHGEYSYPLTEASGGFVNFGYRWQSGQWKTLLQDPDSFMPGFGVFNIGTGVTSERWKLTLFCNNLFKQNYALTKSRDGNWNINPYGGPGATTNAIKWTPARDSARYVGVRLAIHN